MAAAPRGELRRRPTRRHVRRFHVADRFPVSVQLPGRLDLRAERHHLAVAGALGRRLRSEEHTSELQSQSNLVCRLLLAKKKKYGRGRGFDDFWSDALQHGGVSTYVAVQTPLLFSRFAQRHGPAVSALRAPRPPPRSASP